MILLLIEAGKMIARQMRPVSWYGMGGVLMFWIDGLMMNINRAFSSCGARSADDTWSRKARIHL